MDMMRMHPKEPRPASPPYIRYNTRRGYELWFKLQLVEESLVPGASVSVVARRHDINANLLFSWRKQYREGVLGPSVTRATEGLVPLGVIGKGGRIVDPGPPAAAAQAPALAPPKSPYTGPVGSGAIELQLSDRIKVRVEGDVGQDMLRRVLTTAREFA